MGETRAAASLYQALRKAYPETPFVVSTTTETGQAEAKRSLPNADAYFYLPLDITWIVAKLVRRLQPAVLILVEGDIWPNLLNAAKKQGVKLFLVNGKISEKSTKRFGYFPAFTKNLFSLFDILCVQTKVYKERFVQIGAPAEKIFVTGNLKYDAKFPELTYGPRRVEARAQIQPQDRVITIGSTHDPEEDQLPRALADIPNLKILLVPRHPERFEALAKRYLLPIPSRAAHRGGTDDPHRRHGSASRLLPTLRAGHRRGEFCPPHRRPQHHRADPVRHSRPLRSLYGGAKRDGRLSLEAKAGAQVSLSELPAAVKQILETPFPP